MGENQDEEPLAKTRTRRSNAGARMHEMIFAAEDNEILARNLGLLKGDDDSSDDEEYVPNDLEVKNKDQNEDGNGEDSNTDDSTSDSNSDSDDEDDEEDDEEEDEEKSVGEDDQDTITTKQCKPGDDSFENVHKQQHATKVKQENTSYQKSTSHIQPGSPTKAAYDSCKKICSVCLGDQSDEDDEIIECDSCGVSVHESCYGVSGEETAINDTTSVHSNISSESTEPWFCEPCRKSVINPFCELCPNTGGIFKQTDTGRWIHMVCALYTRGVTFENIDNLSGVSLFELNYALYGSKVSS